MFFKECILFVLFYKIILTIFPICESEGKCISVCIIQASRLRTKVRSTACQVLTTHLQCSRSISLRPMLIFPNLNYIFYRK
jgi:hypothetical protein